MIRKMLPGIGACCSSFIFTAAVFPQLPHQVASHWATDGTPNGWMPRVAFLLLLPALSLFVPAVLSLAPEVDSRRANFDAHAGSYFTVVNATLVLLAAGNVLATAVNLGWNAKIEWMGYGLGAFLFVVGNTFTRLRPNGIMGVRTPWTHSSEHSWRITQRTSGYGLVLLGLATIIATAVNSRELPVVLFFGVLSVAGASLAASFMAARENGSGQD